MHFELSANFWKYDKPIKHETELAIAISPVVVKSFAMINKRPLSLEFGIGMSLVSNKEFAGKNIGSYYQFENRLGFSYPLNDERTKIIAIRYMHYSNGGLSSNNPGLDFPFL